MNRLLPACLAVLLLTLPAVVFALSDQDQADLREFAAVAHLGGTVHPDAPATVDALAERLRQLVQEDIDAQPALSPAARARARSELDRRMPRVRDEIVDTLKTTFGGTRVADYMALEGYGPLLGMAQVHELTAFYKTPTGRKLVRELPSIMQDVRAGMSQQAVMAKHFTEPEQLEVKAFYDSPAELRAKEVEPQVEAKATAFYNAQVIEAFHKFEQQLFDETLAAARP